MHPPTSNVPAHPSYAFFSDKSSARYSILADFEVHNPTLLTMSAMLESSSSMRGLTHPEWQ